MGARVTLSGTLVDSSGQPLSHALLRLHPTFPHALTDATTGHVVARTVIDIHTGADGTFCRDGLYACDDPDLSPGGWTYEVREPTGMRYWIALSVAHPEQAWCDVVPISEPASLATRDAADGQLRATRVAAVAVSGHRVVTPQPDGRVAYASASNPDHANVPLWLTDAAAAADATVPLVMAGPVVEPSWSWLPGRPVYLGFDGVLTQTAPSAPSVFAVIGTATAPTTLVVDPRTRVQLT